MGHSGWQWRYYKQKSLFLINYCCYNSLLSPGWCWMGTSQRGCSLQRSPDKIRWETHTSPFTKHNTQTHKQHEQQRNMTPPKSYDSSTREFKVLWCQNNNDELKSSQQSDISQSRPWEGKLETQEGISTGAKKASCCTKKGSLMRKGEDILEKIEKSQQLKSQWIKYNTVESKNKGSTKQQEEYLGSGMK